jgi:sulfate permease, SulP family
MAQFLPFLKWLPDYRKQDLPGDLIAGLTVAIMLVPQSMAYAMLAGLPPVVGLYASILPVLVYGLLGSTPILTLGPTAITSVMVLSNISMLAAQDTSAYLTLALTLAFILGVIYLLMGIFRLGFVVNLLSQPVLVAYINAAALVIIFSQVQHLLGIFVPSSSQPYKLILDTIKGVGDVNGWSLAIGLCGMGIIVYFRVGLENQLKYLRVPTILRFTITRSGPLVVAALAMLVVFVFRLDENAGVRTIGNIPKGFPSIRFDRFDFSHFDTLLVGALAIAFVGFMEGISTAKSLASQTRRRIDANQELVAMGAANIAAAISGGYPVTTSISRSAVNFTAGAKTGLSSVLASAILAIVVMFLTPLFYYLPTTVLAAIISTSVIRLIDFSSVRQMWRYSHLETLSFGITFLAVFTTSIEIGILAGIFAQMILHIWRTSSPRILRLGRYGYSEYYRDVTRYDTMSVPHVQIVRVDESLYFANVQFLDRQLRNIIADYADAEHLILVGTAINAIDASALQILTALVGEFKEAGVTIYFASFQERVMDRLRHVHFVDQVGEQRFFETTHEAVKATGQLPDDELPI